MFVNTVGPSGNRILAPFNNGQSCFEISTRKTFQYHFPSSMGPSGKMNVSKLTERNRLKLPCTRIRRINLPSLGLLGVSLDQPPPTSLARPGSGAVQVLMRNSPNDEPKFLRPRRRWCERQSQTLSPVSDARMLRVIHYYQNNAVSLGVEFVEPESCRWQIFGAF